MKRILLFSLLLTTTIFASAQTVEEIISKHVEAVGGLEAWRKVSSIKYEGAMVVQGAEVAVVQTVLHNKGSRQDISLAGMKGFNIMTPVAGWNFMPFNGQMQPEPLTEELAPGKERSRSSPTGRRWSEPSPTTRCREQIGRAHV